MMQPTLNTNPVQVVVLTQPGIIDKQSRYKNMKSGFARHLIGLGVTQFLIGILCIIFQGVAVEILVNGWYNSIDYIGHGIWNGLLFLITGLFGIAGGIRRSRCQIITFNVLSILSAVFPFFLISIAVPGIMFHAIGTSKYCDNYQSYCDYAQERKTGIAMESMMLILGLVEVIIAITSSVVCCNIGACCCHCGGWCCCPPRPLQNQFPMTGQSFLGQQQIVIATQQPVFLPGSPQLMFPPNPQQPMFAHNPQQPFIGLDPQQQYYPQQPYPSPYIQQFSA